MFNLCDIHFHTNLSFDAYENIGAERFDIDNLCTNYFLNDSDDEKNVKLICATDHNIFNFEKYNEMKNKFKTHNILLLPGIEINGDDKVHWIFIFDDICLSKDNNGQILEEKIKNIFGYNETEDILIQAKKVQSSRQNVLRFVEKLIECKIDFLAVPHMDKSSGWFDVIKKDPEQLKRINYYLCDGIINGFESKKMQDAIIDKIKTTEEYIDKHSKDIDELEKKINSETDLVKKQEFIDKKESLLTELTREETFLAIPQKLQECIDFNDTASIYGSDYHGAIDVHPYRKDELFYMTSDVSYAGLKYALLDWYSRIFSLNRKQRFNKSGNYIISSIDLIINGKTKSISFSDGLNSIIGSRGSGKSFLVSSILNNAFEYSDSDIARQIKITNINFLNHAPSKALSNLQYDYISQKNGTGKNEKNIYNLLAKAPYSFSEFKKGIETFYTPQTQSIHAINSFFDEANKVLDNYSSLCSIREKKIDLSFIDKYNEFYLHQTEDIKISNLFQTLFIKLNSFIENYKVKKENIVKVIADVDAFLNDFKTIENDRYVKEDLENSLLVSDKFSELIKVRDILKNSTTNKVSSQVEHLQKIAKIVEKINKTISNSSDNIKNILDDSIIKLQNSIHQYTLVLKDTKEKENIFFGKIEKPIEDNDYYSFDSETNMFDLFVRETLDINNLTSNQLSEIFRNYNTINDLSSKTIKDIFKIGDFGEYFCNNILPKVDKRSKNIHLIRPSIEPGIYFQNSDGEIIDWKSQSPGQRSDLLLGCILTSKSSKILIIDQPEDDLDNETIYNKMVSLIRNIKLNRQVIIVTHNANLAITADSGKIIICENNNNNFDVLFDSMESKEKYVYHSINGKDKEDTIINLSCDILEGGRKALKQRINKIGIRELIYGE